MKKFILSILCAAVFFIGLGSLIQETGARFKSDERAVNLIKQAQTAIGGETAVQNVKSLSITGTVSKTFDFDGTTKTEQGELEIALQFPNKFNRMVRFGHQDGTLESKSGDFKKRVNVMVVEQDGEPKTFQRVDSNAQKQEVFVMKKGNGKIVLNEENGSTEGKKVFLDKDVIINRAAGFHQNELLRTTLALLMTTPQGADVQFMSLGDGDVDGNACDIVEARTGESTVKLFLDKSSHLPRMISFQGFKPMIFKINRDEMKNEANVETRVFNRKLEKPEMAEIQIRFSDYRSVNGVLLPHRWTQTIGGNADETVDITAYEINPANIAEKFQNLPTRELIRVPRKAQ